MIWLALIHITGDYMYLVISTVHYVQSLLKCLFASIRMNSSIGNHRIAVTGNNSLPPIIHMAVYLVIATVNYVDSL